MSVNDWPTITPEPPAKPWYSSKAWFAFAIGGIGIFAATALGVRSASVTVSISSLMWTSGAVALIGWGFLFAGYLRSRGLFSRKESR